MVRDREAQIDCLDFKFGLMESIVPMVHTVGFGKGPGIRAVVGSNLNSLKTVEFLTKPLFGWKYNV